MAVTLSSYTSELLGHYSVLPRCDSSTKQLDCNGQARACVLSVLLDTIRWHGISLLVFRQAGRRIHCACCWVMGSQNRALIFLSISYCSVQYAAVILNSITQLYVCDVSIISCSSAHDTLFVNVQEKGAAGVGWIQITDPQTSREFKSMVHFLSEQFAWLLL